MSVQDCKEKSIAAEQYHELNVNQKTQKKQEEVFDKYIRSIRKKVYPLIKEKMKILIIL